MDLLSLSVFLIKGPLYFLLFAEQQLLFDHSAAHYFSGYLRIGPAQVYLPRVLVLFNPSNYLYKIRSDTPFSTLPGRDQPLYLHFY